MLGIGLLVLGCDDLDPGALLPQDFEATLEADAAQPADASSPGAGAAEAATLADSDDTADASPRDPDMQSIGPDGSLRVYYQFIDDRGQVQFVERLGDVPAAWRDRVGYVEMSQPPPLTPLEARRSSQLSATRSAEILLAGDSGSSGRRMDAFAGGDGVILYSATWCGYCRKARAHLDRARVDYEIRDVDQPRYARELREKSGRGGVPVLDFDGQILRGYSAEQYDRAIRAIRG